MRFAPDFLDEIRARLPISSVIGSRVVFDHKKSNATRGDFWACCPFHSEKTPSFHCDDKRGRYHCFGCGASGDHFRFLSELEGVSFTEAVERLAGEAGLALPDFDDRTQEKAQERKNLHDVMALATTFFQNALKDEAAQGARHYLRSRDISPKLVDQFRLGFAPNSRNSLKEYLVSQGVGLEIMARCGLIVSGEDIALPYDRFRNRIIFPICDMKGHVIGFGGRAMEPQARAKYLNSPETELFHKGEILYNFNFARAALQKKTKEIKEHANQALPPSLIVVEGYMDVIALHRAGFAHSVAPLGTALTPAQLQLLWRVSAVPILCFDGDEAGMNAAFRALDRALPLLAPGQSLQFIVLPAGKDPDDVVREGGGEAIAHLLQQARPLVDMLMLRETQKLTLNTPEARALLEKNLRRAAFMIDDESLRHYYLQELRARARSLFRHSLQPNYEREKKPWTRQAPERPQGQQRARGRQGEQGGQAGGFSPSLASSQMVKQDRLIIPLREAAIMAMLINHPSLFHEYFEQFSQLEFTNAQMLKLHQTMLDILAMWQPDDGIAMRKLIADRGQQTTLNEIDALLHRAGMRSAFSQAPLEDAKEALKQALHLHFHAHNLHKRLQEVEQDFLNNPDSDMLAILHDVRLELERANATQALIDGFGDWQAELKES